MRLYSELVQPQQVMIECKIKSNGGSTITQNPFTQQDYLIGRSIIGLQVFSSSDISRSPLGTNLPVIPDALMPYAFLNINRSGQGPIKAGVWYKNIPLCTLRHVFNANGAVSSNLDLWRCDPMTIQWPDTNVSFPTPTAQAGEYSVPFLVTFILPEQDPNQYRMAFLRGQAPQKIHGYDLD